MSLDQFRIISAASNVTPGWVTRALHRNGIATDTDVGAVRVVLSKKLPVSSVHRLAVEYADGKNDGHRPRTLFLKLGGARGEFEATDIAGPEVEFYNELAPGIGCPPLIRCYDAVFDEETGRSHVLMEDLTETHNQPEQKSAPSEAMSRRAIEALAKVHAVWWKNSASDLGSGISDCGAGEPAVIENASSFNEEWLRNFVEDLGKNVPEFSDAARLTKKQKEAYARMLGAAPRIWGRLLDKNGLTVTHGDLHWWNYLYPNDAARDSVRLFDWQLWHVDLGARDLAFLLALGGFAEPRPAIESSLLRSYHEALGVEGYTWEMLMHDYRWSAIRNLNIPIIYWKQGKHYSTWQDALRRALDAFERLGCAELAE